MCGVVGILSKKKVAVQIHDLLMQLQHRGQDAAGIITANERFNIKIGQGLVKDIFTSFYLVWPSRISLYLVIDSFTEFYRVLPRYIDRIYKVFTEFDSFFISSNLTFIECNMLWPL